MRNAEHGISYYASYCCTTLHPSLFSKRNANVMNKKGQFDIFQVNDRHFRIKIERKNHYAAAALTKTTKNET